MYIDQDHKLSNLPADIILFCDEDALLFKAIVKHYSPEVDAKIAEELGYLNFHHRRRTAIGLVVSYFQFEFFSLADGRLYRVTRFDTLEDAARFLLSEPYKERGAVLVCPLSRKPERSLGSGRSVPQVVETTKALIRSTLGFSCAAVLFDELSKERSQDTEYGTWTDEVTDFTGCGIIEKGMVTRIEGSTKAMLDAKKGLRPSQKAWWCPSPLEQLQSMLTFFNWKLPHYTSDDKDYADGFSMKSEHMSQILTARFYCFHEKEGGSQITATDNFNISIAGRTVGEGHILSTPGSAIEPGELCQDNVLLWLDKAVVVDSRDHFIVRTKDGASIGVGMVVSCS